MAGRGGAEAEQIGGAEAEPQQRGRGCDRRRGDGEERQRCTHADRMHPEPPRAPTGTGDAAWLDRGTRLQWGRSHALRRGTRAAHAAGGGAGLPSRPHALTAPPDAPQATTGGTGCGASTHRTPCPQRAHRCPTERGAERVVQIPTHRTKTSHSRTG